LSGGDGVNLIDAELKRREDARQS